MLVAGKVWGKLLNPYAIATSSIISHSCRMSGRVAGTSTNSSSGLEGDIDDVRPIVWSRLETSVDLRERPVHELTYDVRTVACRPDISGLILAWPSGEITLTGSILLKKIKLLSQQDLSMLT